LGKIELKYAWSDSRMKTLRECARKYWFNYYASWEGWLKNAPPRKKQAYLLKHLSTRHMWPGSIVHNVIENVIKTYKSTDKWIPLVEARELGLKQLKLGWKSSTRKEWKNNPKSVNLYEHYYSGGLSKEETDRCKDIVLDCITGFYNCRMAKIIRSLKKDDWVALEDFQSFNMDDGSEVSVKIDCGFKYNGKIYLLDWKTGKINDSVLDQLTTYSMYALKKGFTKKLSDIVIVPVYLIMVAEIGDSAIVELSVTKDKLLSHAATIKNESIILRQSHEHKEDEEYFKMTDNLNNCKYCNFKEICPGGKRI